MTVLRKLALVNYRSITRTTIGFGQVTVIIGPSDSGKCLGRGTPVLLASGHTVPVEAVKVGDRLMGPDGYARTVQTTTRGVGPLYRITPRKGEPWVCNGDHVLTTVRTDNGVVEDVSVHEWLSSSENMRVLRKQFLVGVDNFEAVFETLSVDPYFLGVWFGDGTKTLGEYSDGSKRLKVVSITNPDPEVIECCHEIAQQWGLSVKIYEKDRCPMIFLWGERGGSRGQNNQLLNAMRDLLGEDLRIPESVMRGSRKTRRQFLAGFLDSDGDLGSNCFSITQKREDWARAAWWLARSLGLCSTIKARTAKNQDGFEGTYWRVSISGHTDQIPTRIPRKQAKPRMSRRNPSRTGITVEPMGKGEYFGFSLDGDGRFLLGDFTVTHNSNLVRALRDWAFNAGGTSFITEGATTCRIAVAVGANEKVVFEKSAAGKVGASRYVTVEAETHAKHSYEKIGLTVPQEVQEVTKIKEIQIDDLKVKIHFAEQAEPWFLLSPSLWTPAKVSKVIGRIAGIDALILANRDLVNQRTASNREVKRLKAAIDENEKRLETFPDLDRIHIVLEKVVARGSLARERTKRLEKSKRLIKEVAERRRRIKQLTPTTEAINEALNMVDHLDLHDGLDRLQKAEQLTKGVERGRSDLARIKERVGKAKKRLTDMAKELIELSRGKLICGLCGGEAHPDCREALARQAKAATQ